MSNQTAIYKQSHMDHHAILQSCKIRNIDSAHADPVRPIHRQKPKHSRYIFPLPSTPASLLGDHQRERLSSVLMIQNVSDYTIQAPYYLGGTRYPLEN